MIEKGACTSPTAPGGAIGAVAILPPSPWADAEKGARFVAGTDDAAIVSLLGRSALPLGPKPGDQSSAESIPAQIFGYLPFDTPACQLVAEGKVDGWARHSKTFEDVYGWEAAGARILAAAAK